MDNKEYRLLPVALHPAIKEALKRYTWMPESAWQDVIEAADRVKLADDGSEQVGRDITLNWCNEPVKSVHWTTDEGGTLNIKVEFHPFIDGGKKITLNPSDCAAIAHIENRVSITDFSNADKLIAAPERSGKAADEDAAFLQWVKAHRASWIRIWIAEGRPAASSSAAPSDVVQAAKYRALVESAAEGYPSSEGCRDKDAYLVITGYEHLYPMTEAQKHEAVTAAIGEVELRPALATPSVQAVAAGQEWISVDDRLPSVGEMVLVYAPNGPHDYPDDIRISFDCIDENDDEHKSWLIHNENYEHYCCVAKPEGSIGPSAKAPYTHWASIPKPPALAGDTQAGE